MTTNPTPDLRPYSDESLLAAVDRHGRTCGLTMDPAYRTACGAPEELLIRQAQFKILVTELERRDVCGSSDLFEPDSNLCRVGDKVRVGSLDTDRLRGEAWREYPLTVPKEKP